MPITVLLDLVFERAALAEAPAVLRETLAATRTFPGCSEVEVLVDVEDPAHVVVRERWDSLEADAAYRAWRATPEGASRLRTVLAAPPTLTRFGTADGD